MFKKKKKYRTWYTNCPPEHSLQGVRHPKVITSQSLSSMRSWNLKKKWTHHLPCTLYDTDYSNTNTFMYFIVLFSICNNWEICWLCIIRNILLAVIMSSAFLMIWTWCQFMVLKYLYVGGIRLIIREVSFLDLVKE